MTDEPYVSVKEIMPRDGTCCWVMLFNYEGPVPAMWDGEKWRFQLRGHSKLEVTHWRVNSTGCHWYFPNGSTG